MEESEDNMSSEDMKYDDGSSNVKVKPKKRSLVERELETNLTARVTSPITNLESSSTSRYGRARRLKTDSEVFDTDKMIAKPKSPNPKIDKSPSKIQSPAYKMHASNSPIRVETPKRSENSLENQIENIYTENISLSRFGSEEKKNKSSTKKYPKVYVRKDLIQTKDKDQDDTVVLIKNMFSPSNSSKKSNYSYSSEKYNSNTKKPNGYINSVVKTLDFDGNKKKKVVERKSLSKSELFDIEAKCEYQVGDLAWARMGTYPFWPCIITRDPLTEMFVKKKLFGRIEHDVLHVTFFGDNGRRGWIVDSMLRKFRGQLEFDEARKNFTTEAKKKDPRLYAAFFVSEKKTPLWQVSVDEAETLLKEPKRLRIDILNDMLEKSRHVKTTPKLEKSKKITRTNSDVSLSESLYDTLFSEDDSKGNDSDRSRSKSRNRSLNVSEVVTACLDNMAAKTGITKIQRQSHMDRWLQKAKSKTPEKSQLKSNKLSNSVKTKKKTHEETQPKKFHNYRKSSLESQSENKLQPHQNEHDYSQKYCDRNSPIIIDDVEIEYENAEIFTTDSVEPGSGLGVISKVETLCDKNLLDKNEDDMILTVVNDEIVISEPESSEFYGQINLQSNTSGSNNENILEESNSIAETATENTSKIDSFIYNAESIQVDNTSSEEVVAVNSFQNDNDDNIKEKHKNNDVPPNDCNQSNNMLNSNDVEESMELSERTDIEPSNMNEILNNDLIIDAFCVSSSANKPNEAHTNEGSNVRLDNLQIKSKSEKDIKQGENSNHRESPRRKSKRLSRKDTKVNDIAPKAIVVLEKNLIIDGNIGIEYNITDKMPNESCDKKDGLNNKECFEETSSKKVEETIENKLIEPKLKNQERNSVQTIDNVLLDENIVLNNVKQNTDVIKSILPNSIAETATENTSNIDSFIFNAERIQVDDTSSEEVVAVNSSQNDNDDNIKEKHKNNDVPPNDCYQSNNMLNTNDVEESMELSERTDIEPSNMNEILNNDLIIDAFCASSSANKPNEAHTNEGSNVHLDNLQIKSKSEKDIKQGENSNHRESPRRKSKRLSRKDTKVNDIAPKAIVILEKKLIIDGNIGIEYNITDKMLNESCDKKDDVNNKECYEETSSKKVEETIENKLIEPKLKNQERNSVQTIDNVVLDENIVLNNVKQNTDVIESILPNSVAESTTENTSEIDSFIYNAGRIQVDNTSSEEVVAVNSSKNDNDDNIKENHKNNDVPPNDCNQSNNMLNTNDVEEIMELSEHTDIEPSNMNEILNNDLIIDAFCVSSSANKPNEAHTNEGNNVRLDNLQIKSKSEKDIKQGENSNHRESPRRKSKRLSRKNTKVNDIAPKAIIILEKNLIIDGNIGIEYNITDKMPNVSCDKKDGVNNKECYEETSSNKIEETIENKLIEPKLKNREHNSIQIIDNVVLDENIVLNNVKQNTDVIESILPKISPKPLMKFKLSLNKSPEKANTSLPLTIIDPPEKKSKDCNLVEKFPEHEDIAKKRYNEDCTMIENNISVDSISNTTPVAMEDKIIQNSFMEHDHYNFDINNIKNQKHTSIEPKPDIEKETFKVNNEINEQNTDNNMATENIGDYLTETLQVEIEPVILNSYNENYKTMDEVEKQSNIEKCQSNLVDQNTPNTDNFDAETYSIHDNEDMCELRLSTSSPLSNTNSDNMSEKKVEDITDKKESEKAEIDPDSISMKSEDSEVSIGRKKRVKDKKDKRKILKDPEFLKYLELRQDAVMDEFPDLSQEDITNYLYKTWLYEESLKTDTKKADDIDHANLVKGLNQDTVPVKKMRKRIKVEKEKYKDQNIDSAENIQKEKSKRKIIRPYYREDFSDVEDLEYYDIFKIKPKPKSCEYSKETNKVESVQNEVITTEVKIEFEEEIGQDEIDQVEEYFRQLTAPKPNLFKGLIREKVCEICERIGNLVKCKGCHCMFHVDCDIKQTGIVEMSVPVRGRKKKKKNRGRKAKEDPNGLDSESQSDEKSQDANVSEEIQNTSIDEEESHIVANADEFEAQLSAKMKDMLENPNDLDYDSLSNDELDWNDIDFGQCKIVDIKPRTKDRDASSDFSDFKCSNCQKYDTPICFVCKSNISPKNKAEYRQRCQVAHCQKYYHLECLDHWPQTQFNWGELSRTNKRNEYSEPLSCPRHVCHTCVCDDPRGCKTRFSGDKLAKCVRCPATYHTFTKCLPAGTQILTGSHIICPRHYEHRPGKVPCHVNTGWCFICALGGSLICCEYCPTSFHAECLNIKPPEGGYMCEDCETGRLPLYGEMVWVKLGHYRWWPGIILHPSEIPQNILAVKHSPGEFVVRFFGQYDHYWVNRGRVFPFQEGDSGKVSSQRSKIDAAFTMAMEHAQRACEILKTASPNDEESIDIASSLLPPHYVKLKVNKPCGSLCAKKIDHEESSLTQCECDPNDFDPCGPYTQCLNRMLLTECGPTCRAGDRCNNRAFEKRLYPKMVPYRTPHRGWGLKTLVDIKAGQFVIEYVGELLDEAEFRRRMRRKHDLRDENYYFLTLDKERMIDAGPKGNFARFMNHSCEPNCETQKWTVLGDIRVGLFALYDIPANSELTFNYNLESAGIEKKRCMCGAKRCSGYIGAKPKQEEQPKKTKLPTKRTYKKRKTLEDSPSTSRNKPKNRIGRPYKPRELTEIEKDLLIIKNATNAMSSDSECSVRLCSVDSSKDSKALKRKLTNVVDELSSPTTKRFKSEKSIEE